MAVLSHSQLASLWILAGGSAATADTAAAIAQAESGGNTNAVLNTAYPKLPGYHPPGPGALPEYSVGLWQINLLAHPQYTAAQMLAQLSNADAAVAISNRGTSFSAWSTYTSGAYKNYLQAGGTPTPQPGTTATATPGTAAASTHRGYADLRNSLGRHLPRQLQISHATGVRTLRLLGSRHKLGR